MTADCGPDQCPEGCCRDGVCEAGTTTDACGSGGNLCDTCVGDQVCNGRCESGAGGGSGGGTGAGGGTASGGGAAMGGGTATGGGGQAPCTTDTWASFGSGFFSSNCSRCHGSAYDSHSNVQSQASTLSSVISSGFMPRGGGISTATRAEAVKYLNCGAP